MVITSIILLVLTDGLSLFGQYSRLITNRVGRNAEVWNGYCRLESLITSTDSLIALPSGGVEIYSNGEAGILWISDSMLLFMIDKIKDTLFHSVAGMTISYASDGNDSLSITLFTGGERLRIAFAPCPKPKESTYELRDLEERYGYE